MDDFCTHAAPPEHCGDRRNPSCQSRVVAVRENTKSEESDDARDRQCQDCVVRSGDCELPAAAFVCPSRAPSTDQGERWKRISNNRRIPDGVKRRSKQKNDLQENACAANRICESGSTGHDPPPSIAPIRKAKSAVNERAMDSPDSGRANARITTFPVMFAVEDAAQGQKTDAVHQPVTTVIPSRGMYDFFSVGLLDMNN